MMKTLKFIVLLSVMLVNVTPYIKDGKVEWKTTQAAAQNYIIEGIRYTDGLRQYLCVNESKPSDSFWAYQSDCIKQLKEFTVEGCKCFYCNIAHPCEDTCKNMECPDKIKENLCDCCLSPKSYE